MTEFITLHELPIIQEQANDPQAPYQAQAKLLLLIQGGLSVRQAAAKTGFSPSGVQYWVNRFRKLRMEAFQLKNRSPTHLAPVVAETKKETSVKQKANKSEEHEPSDAAGGENGIERQWIYTEFSLPKRLDSPGIRPDDTLAEAGRKTLLFHFLKMLENEEGTIQGEDIESLHDMRVATRRMRAAFDVFGSEYRKKAINPILKGLRRTGRALGNVRDLDVFMEKANSYLDQLPVERRCDLDALFHNWQDQRIQFREKMILHLESFEHQKFLSEFARFLTTKTGGRNDTVEHPKTVQTATAANLVQSAVPLLVYTRLASVNAYEKILPTANITQLHALRIELKRLRYTLEFFSEVLGNDVNFVIKEIKGLQDHLGDMNDANVACTILSDFLNNWENLHSTMPLVDRPNPEPVVAYLAFRADERHKLLVTFPSAWEAFKRPEIRRKLALSIAIL